MTDFPPMELEAKLTLDFLDCATQIEFSCAEILKPPPAGIYMATRLDPVMVDGKNYYIRVGNTTELVTDVNTITENIYGEDAKLVIPKSILLKRDKCLSNYPLLPYRGAKILESLVNQKIDDFVQYRTSGAAWTDKILRHFNDDAFAKMPAEESAEDWLTQTLDDCWQSTRAELELFLGSRSWNMYLVKLGNRSLSVERYCDWRAYQWEQEHGATFRKSSR